jgi:hypothetical protein
MEELEPRPFFLLGKREPPLPLDPLDLAPESLEPLGGVPEPAGDPVEEALVEESELQARKAWAASALASWELEASSKSRYDMALLKV